MEKKQGFFSALREEVVRGLSPGRSRAKSPGRVGSSMSGRLFHRKSRTHDNNFENPENFVSRSGSMRTLTPLIEGPDPNGGEIGDSKRVGLGQWMMGQLSRTPSMNPNVQKRSDLRLLLGVMGAPLAPVHVSTDPLPHLSIKDTPIVCIFNSLFLPFLEINIFYVCIFCGVWLIWCLFELIVRNVGGFDYVWFGKCH